MKRALRIGRWVSLASLLAGCDPRGISVGTEELCVADALLERAIERNPDLAPSGCARIGDNLVRNGSFELPLTGDCMNGLYCEFAAAAVPAWTTDSEVQIIEIWRDSHMGVPTFEGAQFAELNASSRDTLSQDLSLTPGQLVYWSVAHRGRTGVEGMEVGLGPPEAVRAQGLLSTAEEAWSEYHGLYRVGDAETTTRLSLISRSGNAEGNLVDAVVLANVIER